MGQETLADVDSVVCDKLGVTLYGQFRLTSGERHLVLSARKDQALVAFLACSLTEPVQRSRLAALLWPMSEDARARESLKQSLLRLRRALPDGVLQTDRHSACLNLDQRQVDVSRLAHQLALGSCKSLTTALNLYSDNFLHGLEDVSSEFEDWRNATHTRIQSSIKEAATVAMREAEAADTAPEAMAIAQMVLRLDPLDEEAIRLLMRAYAADDRIRLARETFERLKTQLQDELGAVPESATLSLAESILPDTESAVQMVRPTVPRVAVHAFSVVDDEHSQRYFAEGLTDDITTDLARNKSLEVLPASSFTGSQQDLSQTLSELGATHVLHGSVRRSEGRLRVNTRLIDTQDNQIVWAQRYECKMEDLFDMQDTISSQIVMRLPVELSPDAVDRVEHGTRNAHAYEMFLKGRSLYLRGINNHSLRAAKALLDRAIEIDPEFARAYAQLAICESYLAMGLVNKTGEDFSAQVLDHGRVALDMNPDLAMGHAAVGLAFYASGRYQEAEHALQSAIEIDENLFEAQFFLARNRRLQGDHEGAVDRFRIAAALRPEDYRSSGLLGDALKATGQVDMAAEVYAVAISRIEAELEHHPDNAGALAFGAPVLYELGRRDRAKEWGSWALAIEPDDCLLRYNLARLSAMFADPVGALEHLEAAFKAPLLVQRRLALWMRHDQDLKCLAANRRYRGFLEYAGHKER